MPQNRFNAQSGGGSVKEEAVFKRNGFLRMIIRTAFAAQGNSPVQADADLSSRLSEKIFSVVEASGVHGLDLQHRVQLFATMTLLETELCGKQAPAPLAASFITEVLGTETARGISDDDFRALDQIGAAVKTLLLEPEWANAHGGHCAMSCMSLLSLYDVSILTWRTPQGSGTW